MKFKQYIDESDTISMIELAYFLDEYNINEAIDVGKGLKTILTKVGLKAKKEKGLLQILSGVSKDIGLIFYYLFKYQMTSDEQYRVKIKETIKKVSKEDIVDVLLKLDILTLHVLTGPIHALNALTGWHISVNAMKNTAQDISQRAKKVLQHLKVLQADTVGETKKKLTRFDKQIKQVFKYSSQISDDVLV